MLSEQCVDPLLCPGTLRSPGLLHGHLRLGLHLIHLLLIRLFLIDKRDYPILGLIAPDVSFALVAGLIRIPNRPASGAIRSIVY